MWSTAAASVGLVAAVAVLVSGQFVHFDYTHKNCSEENYDLVTDCRYQYGDVFWYALFGGMLTDEFHCILQVERIACIETALCHCNYSADHIIHVYGILATTKYVFDYNNSYCANETHGETIQSDVFGPIEAGGINCSKYNRTIGDLAVSLAFANEPAVLDLNGTCEGIRACYVVDDQRAAEALYQRDLPKFCSSYGDLISCLVDVICACNQTTNDTMVSWMNDEREYYESYCSAVVDFPIIKKRWIACPAVSICVSPEPIYDCLEAYYQAVSPEDISDEEECSAELSWADCIENLACECGFHDNSAYYRTLATSKHVYYYSNCELLTGPFPNHTDLNCSDDGGLSELERLLTISLAEAGFVSTEEGSCSAVVDCYNRSLANLTLAHRRKDATAICQIEAERFGCLEQAYCDCGLLSDPDVSERLEDEEYDIYALCIFIDVQVTVPETPCFGQNVMFERTHQNCSEEWNTVVTECWDLYFDARDFLTDSEEYVCMLKVETVACIETALCHCNYNRNHSIQAFGYYVSSLFIHGFTASNCSSKNYGENIQSEVLGAIDFTEGVDCSRYNRTVGELAVSLAFANDPAVLELEGTCEGIHACYMEYDMRAAEALYQKDIAKYCLFFEDLISCLVLTICACNQTENETMADWVDYERYYYENDCYSVVDSPVFSEQGIKCPPVPRDPVMERKCSGITQCYSESEEALMNALADYDDIQFCQADATWIGCQDEALCKCKLHGKEEGENYMATQTSSHTNKCGSKSPITRKQCVTSSADHSRVAAALLAVLITLTTVLGD